MIQVKDSEDQVTVKDWFKGEEYKVAYIQPDGGNGIPASSVDGMFDDNSGGNEPGGNTGEDGVPAEDTFDAVKTGTDVGEQLVGNNGTDLLKGLDGDDQLFSFGGNDWIVAGKGNDYIDGGEGDDHLLGGEGNDQLGGDAGNDLLMGGAGDDKYIFKPGAGQDVIDNTGGGTDWLFFTDGLTLEKLSFVKENDDLVIKVKESDDQVTVKDWFKGDEYKVSYIQPADGTGIPASRIEEMLEGGSGGNEPGGDTGEIVIPAEETFGTVKTGTNAGEQLVGTNGTDLLKGLDGNDQLFSFGGNDWIVAGKGDDYLDGGAGDDYLLGGDGNDQLGGDAGNDMLVGGKGDDKYVFNSGSGQDVIDNTGGGTDWLFLGEGLTLDKLSFVKENDDLVIKVNESDDQVTVKNWFKGGDYQVAYIQPPGGYGIPASQITQMTDTGSGNDLGDGEGYDLVPDSAQFDIVKNGTTGGEQLAGTQGNDLLKGDGGDDQFFGLAGDDWLVGGNGNDYFDGGEGADHILGGAGNDQLGGDAGNDFLRAGTGDDKYIYRPGSGNDVIDNRDGGTDWLIFSDGITADRLSYLKDGDDLVVRVDGNPDTQVMVSDWFKGSSYQLAYIQPAGAYGISASQISNMATPMPAMGPMAASANGQSGEGLAVDDINRIIQDMTAFSSDQGIAFSGSEEEKRNTNLMNLVINPDQLAC